MITAPLPSHQVMDIGLLRKRMAIYRTVPLSMRDDLVRREKEFQQALRRIQADNLRHDWLYGDSDR